MKKIAALLLVIATFLSMTVPVYANAIPNVIPDTNRSGSIIFSMKYNGKAMDGGELTMYRVGDIVKKGSGYGFALIAALKDSEISLENLNSANLARKLALQAEKYKLTEVKASIVKGTAKFSDLIPGLYVVAQSEADATKGYAPINPFVISLPQWKDGEYVYDLKADPKTAPEPEKPDKPDKPDEPDEPDEPDKPDKPKLPQTGQLHWPIPLMSFGGLFLIVVGWFLCFGKKGNCEK